MVANPARGQLNRGNIFFLSPCAHVKLVSRDRLSRPLPGQLLILHTEAESGVWYSIMAGVSRYYVIGEPN